MTVSPQSILEFWKDAGNEKWWRKDDAFDALIATRFGATLAQAERGELADWYGDADSTLALILVLDQFTRNTNRNSPKAFSNDTACVSIVKRAIEEGLDHQMDTELRMFCYLPLMHSEDPQDQLQCLQKIEEHGPEGAVKSAIEHKEIIDRFGRFPHRNKVLGRKSTEEEIAFLKAGGFAG